MTSPQSSSSGQDPDAGKTVLRFSDGAQALADPDLFLPKGLAAKISQDTDLSNTIIEIFTVAVAAAMTTAAAKSAAQTRA